MARTFIKLNGSVIGALVLLLASLIDGDKPMSNVHTSTHLLKRLVEDELKFIEMLNHYVSTIEDHANQVRNYTNTVYSNFTPSDDLEVYVSNPLNSVGVIKRTGYIFISRLMPLINNKTWINLQYELINMTSRLFPAMYDYHETCSSIALLQEAYNVNISDLMNGEVKLVNNKTNKLGFKSKFNLTWIQMYDIGVAASNRGWHDSAHIWFKRAIDQCSDKHNPLFIDLNAEYKKNMKIHDHILDTRGRMEDHGTDVRTFNLPLNNKLRKKKKYRIHLQGLKEEGKVDLNEPERTKHYVPLFKANGTQLKSPKMQERARDNFHSLCKDGEKQWRTPEINMNLTCRFHHHQNPYLKVGPFLLEEKNYKPMVVLFHSFMSKHETKYFKETGGNQMKRSQLDFTVGTDKILIPEKSSSRRTSQQGWIQERLYQFPVTDTYEGWDYNGTFHHSLVEEALTDVLIPEYPPKVQDYLIINDMTAFRITKRIELATNLILNKPYASEPYQVANYGIGGQYAIHPDIAGHHIYPGERSGILPKYKKWYSLVGGRHATFMAYLSTVEFGGGTVFPMLGLSNNAVAGQAVFWNNAWSDGRADYLSVHGGCPILLGSKWITNKWIHYYDNFRRTPCELREFQEINTFNTWRKHSI